MAENAKKYKKQELVDLLLVAGFTAGAEFDLEKKTFIEEAPVAKLKEFYEEVVDSGDSAGSNADNGEVVETPEAPEAKAPEISKEELAKKAGEIVKIRALSNIKYNGEIRETGKEFFVDRASASELYVTGSAEFVNPSDATEAEELKKAQEMKELREIESLRKVATKHAPKADDSEDEE